MKRTGFNLGILGMAIVAGLLGLMLPAGQSKSEGGDLPEVWRNHANPGLH